MTVESGNLPGEATEQPFTEEEKKNLTEEEQHALLHPEFGTLPADAEEDDPKDREATDVNNIVDDSGTLEPVWRVSDEFDALDEVI